MRVAVTGAAGLIGGVVFDSLLADGYDVVGIDRPHDEWLAAGRNTEDAAAPSRVTHHFDLAEASGDEWQMMGRTRTNVIANVPIPAGEFWTQRWTGRLATIVVDEVKAHSLYGRLV